ncbi:MAG: hypothetical protein V1784_03765 [bacterium]
MNTTFETNEHGERVKVTTTDSGGIIRELDRPAPADPNAPILARLAEVDAQTTKPRTMRELALGNTDTIAWVRAKDKDAAALRAQLK